MAAADLGDVDVGDRVGAERALDLDLVDNDAPVIGEFVLGLPGVESEAANGGRRPVTDVRFTGIDIVGQLMHTVSSPSVEYLLFVIGLGLMCSSCSAGVGVAGVAGAVVPGPGLPGWRPCPRGGWRRGALRLVRLPSTCRPASPGCGPASAPSSWSGRWCSSRLGELVTCWRVRRACCWRCWRACRHGPHPVLHADDRPGVDGRRDRRGGTDVDPDGVV